jgi:hypothetical protein
MNAVSIYAVSVRLERSVWHSNCYARPRARSAPRTPSKRVYACGLPTANTIAESAASLLRRLPALERR